MGARIGKQLHIVTENKVGMLAEVTGAVAGAGVNIDAMCGYVADGKANFLIITNNNARAMDVLKAHEPKEEDVVVAELENKPGTAAGMATKLKAASIDLHYIYGTTSGKGPAVMVFKSNNNAGAVKALT